jgi:dTMP kinase
MKSELVKRGKFIVIDGSDGSGKKTQSDLLIKKLNEDGHRTAFYDFPQYEKNLFGKMVGDYLNGEYGKSTKINPYLASLLYAGDRWQASPQIKKDIKEGKIVISNRYTSSNMAHQAAKIKNAEEKKKFLKWLVDLEFNVYKIPRPDLVIYLNVPCEVSQQLIETKEKRSYTKKKKDLHEKDVDFMMRSQNEYIELSERYANWQKIDCARDNKILSRLEIAKMIFQVVQKEVQ